MKMDIAKYKQESHSTEYIINVVNDKNEIIESEKGVSYRCQYVKTRDFLWNLNFFKKKYNITKVTNSSNYKWFTDFVFSLDVHTDEFIRKGNY